MPKPSRILLVAALAGLLLGPLDLIAQRELPYPWANLANSSAVWAIAAFAVGRWAGRQRFWPALAAVVCLLLAVESYYAAASLIQNDSWENLWGEATLLWLGFGALAGIIFGTAGAWSREGTGVLRYLSQAVPSAVLFAEAAVLWQRSGNHDGSYRTDSLQTAAINAVLAIVVLLWVSRGVRERGLALLAAVPLGLIGFGGFALAGFGA